MKKISAVLIVLVIISALFAGCSGNSDDKNDVSVIRVGVCAGPYGDMFKEAIQPSLEKKGYKVEITEFSDYVQPNNALAENEIDVNMFQHSTYLKKFCEEHSLELTYITEIPTASMGVFSEKYKSFDEAENGSTVAIPNDDTNLSRALRVLAQTGIITLNPDVDASKASVNDISENPKNLSFTEVSAEILPSVLDSTDFAVINGNYAISAGLDLADAVYNEELEDGYFNVIAVRTEDAEKQFAKDIKDIVHSDDFRNVIDDENNQYSAFARPDGYND
ncbi:MAG TPA: metal ABC transporter substrate-binding protein [Ruminococcus sp.]|nr:metal ABC transporter substrate-binding protein [Ruminococcus sp.]HCR73886.1 metal ABC transporter substrate-binding protein [Ruminococcus sp.]